MGSFRFNNKGIGLVEIFIAITMFVIVVTGALSLLYPAERSAIIGQQKLQAKWYLWEEEEAIRQVRLESWVNLVNGSYYAQYNTTSNPPVQYQGWQLYPGSATKNGFTETITITTPYRVNTNQFSDTSGTRDSNARKVVCSVSWNTFGQSYSQSVTTYLTDWQPF